MFLAVDASQLAGLPRISASMFTDRARQFVGRHNWPLSVSATGFEIDEFDDNLTTYCIEQEGDRHLASVRLRPSAAGSMLERHFPMLHQRSAGGLSSGIEITRFCASPTLSPEGRLNAVADLLLGLCRHCQRSGIDSFYGVVFPSVARVLKQAGWPARILDETRDDRGVLQLAEWTATGLVAWDIQERRELREELLRQRPAARLEAMEGLAA